MAASAARAGGGGRAGGDDQAAHSDVHRHRRQNLIKTYVVGEVGGARTARRQPRRAAGRSFSRSPVRRARGEVDLHAHRRLPGSADIGPVITSAARTCRRCRRTRWPQSAAKKIGFVFQGFNPAVAHVRARQRGAAAPLRRLDDEEARRTAPARHGGADRRRPRQPRRPPSESAVRRSAAARGDRARAINNPFDSAGGRADREPSTPRPASKSWISSSA